MSDQKNRLETPGRTVLLLAATQCNADVEVVLSSRTDGEGLEAMGIRAERAGRLRRSATGLRGAVNE